MCVSTNQIVSLTFQTSFLCSDAPQTPKSKVTRVLTIPPPPTLTSPRFNLRPLASYYTLSCLGLSLGLMWLILLPLWLLILLLLVVLYTAGWSVWKTSEKLTIIMICNCNAILVDYFLYILISANNFVFTDKYKFCVSALDTSGWSVCGIPHRNQL